MPETLTKPLAELADPLPIPTLSRTHGRPIFFARVRPPGSKSLTNRAMLLAALADGRSTLTRALVGADDSERMVECLRTLGAAIEIDGSTVGIDGVSGRWRSPASGITLDAGASGTTARFLAAAALLAPGPATGTQRLHARPIGELTDALYDLGATIEFLNTEGFPPIRVAPPPPESGAVVEIRDPQSSQFISALLLVAPFLPGGLTISLHGKVPSRAYVSMTLGLLDLLGASVRSSDDLRVLRIGPSRSHPAGLGPFELAIEPDASSASYFWAAAALFPGAVARVEGLDQRSLQGDASFPEILVRMGAVMIREDGDPPCIGVRGPANLIPVMADMTQMPDAALALAVVACFAGGRSLIRGLRTLRVKECDRIAALQTELAKIGVTVDTDVLGDPDAITITPPLQGIDCSAAAPPVIFETFDDHRMAMSLALIGLRRPNVSLKDPACVRKTYPTFWRDFSTLL